jgi:TPR repeat protein
MSDSEDMYYKANICKVRALNQPSDQTLPQQRVQLLLKVVQIDPHHLKALHDLGVLHNNAVGVHGIGKESCAGGCRTGLGGRCSKNEEVAYGFYERAAAAGSAESMSNLGKMCESGYGNVPASLQKAYMWHRKGAAFGAKDAQCSFGLCLLNGRGATKNTKQAAVWLHKAANAGSLQAEESLSAMYLEGIGVKKDEEQALALIWHSAEQGHANSQYRLHCAFQSGCFGIKQKNELQSAIWCLRGAVSGQQNCRNILSLHASQAIFSKTLIVQAQAVVAKLAVWPFGKRIPERGFDPSTRTPMLSIDEAEAFGMIDASKWMEDPPAT